MNQTSAAADFFISYTKADKNWAEWIGYVLEEDGFSVVIQAWDFLPGNNFVLEMQKAAEQAARTVLVLSPAYLKSHFAQPEWAAAFVNDPQGAGRKVVPIVVESCQPEGLLKSLVHINLVGQNEAMARDALIAGLRTSRAKPNQRPAFPGATNDHQQKAFPGDDKGRPTEGRPAPYIPSLRTAASDIDKRRFMKQAFDHAADYFEAGLGALAETDSRIEVDFQRDSASEFTAEVFLGGKSAASCRIWRGDDILSDGICFSEGRSLGRNGYNELLSVADEGGKLSLSARMGGFGLGTLTKDIDIQRLSPDQAAEYLWRRLVSRLER